MRIEIFRVYSAGAKQTMKWQPTWQPMQIMVLQCDIGLCLLRQVKAGHQSSLVVFIRLFKSTSSHHFPQFGPAETHSPAATVPHGVLNPSLLLVPASNQASSPIISPSQLLPRSPSLTLQGEATGLMSLNEECCKNPE